MDDERPTSRSHKALLCFLLQQEMKYSIHSARDWLSCTTLASWWSELYQTTTELERYTEIRLVPFRLGKKNMAKCEIPRSCQSLDNLATIACQCVTQSKATQGGTLCTDEKSRMKNPDPAKGAILRTRTSAIQVQTPLFGGVDGLKELKCMIKSGCLPS